MVSWTQLFIENINKDLLANRLVFFYLIYYRFSKIVFCVMCFEKNNLSKKDDPRGQKSWRPAGRALKLDNI